VITRNHPRHADGTALTRTVFRMMALLAVLATPALASAQPTADIGWPRVFAGKGKELTVYQPQVDSWKDHSAIHFRCAIGVKGVLGEERFGIAEVDAVTVVDLATRTVAIVPKKRDLRFGKATEAEAAALRAAVEELAPSSSVTTIALERVLACVEPAS
jgi:hypothetical protein